jgi:Skp family chaperone for outer membrane proteins
MRNRYILSATALFLLASLNIVFAQDSTKKAKPAAAKPVAKPAWKRPVTPAAYGTQPAAGQPVAPVNTDKSLNGQYQYVSSKVYNYQRPPLAAFYKNVTDSLRAERKKSKDLQQKLSAQGKTMAGLQSDVTAKEQSLTESNAKADAISLLGIPVTKTLYNTIMWGLVIVFGAVATVVILQSGSARREAKYRIKLYEELDDEYKAYKVKANDKEKKLARELQTERNRIDELLGRG